jgi:rhodanese-related sulfurtransferase/polyisoprenoid-binding protein YceI
MGNTSKSNELTPEELWRRMESGENLLLIDVLPSDHFQKVRVPNAKNACVFEVTFLNQMQAISSDTNAEIVLCGSSPRSMDAITAVQKLERNGYRRLHILQGGIEAWREAGLALEGEKAGVPEDAETTFTPEDGKYIVDVSQSIIEWTGRNANNKHFGTIGIAGGELRVTGGSMTGEIEIDMNSIKNINLTGDPLQPVLINHLRSDDFFFVKYFPTATLTVNSAKPVKAPCLTSPNYDVKGILELRGMKADLDFPSTISKTADTGFSAEAHFDIDRTRWGVIYGSARFFEHLGMHVVFDLISIQLRMGARRDS